MNDKATKLIKYVLITCLVLYLPYIAGKLVLVYSDAASDTYNSYIPQYELIVNKLINGSFSFLDLSFGLGANIVSSQVFLFDPFSIIPILFGLLFGAKNLAFSIVYMQMIKSIIAGIICFYFLSEFNFTQRSKTLAAYIYAFSGYMIGAGQHYQFATAPLFLILVLLFIEKSMKNKIYLLALTATLALICCWSVFFAFHIILFIGIYILLRILQSYNKITIITKNVIIYIFIILLGIMLAGIIFLPSLYQIIGISSRTTDDTSMANKVIMALKFINFEDLKTSFLRFFSENMQGTVNNWTGGPYHFTAPHYFFTILLILCIPQYLVSSFSKDKLLKEKIINTSIIILVFFSLSNYFFGSLTNVFSTFNWRYTFILTPVFALLVADTLDKIFIKKIFNSTVNYITLIIGVVIVALYYDSGSGLYSKIIAANTIIFLMVVAKLLDYIAKNSAEQKRVTKIAIFALTLCIILNSLVDNFITVNAQRTFLSGKQLSSLYHNESINNIIEYLDEKENDNFYRIEKDFNDSTPLFTYSLVERYRSVSTYNSTLNKNSIEFVRQMGNPYVTPGDILQSYYLGSYGEMFDSIMTDNLGIKYLITQNNTDRSGWILEKQFKDLFLYKNSNIEYAGILYNNYITSLDYASITPVERKLFMADCIILDETHENFREISKVDFKKISNAIDYGQIINKDAWIDSKSSETNEIIGSSWQEGMIEIPLNTNYTNIDNHQNVFTFNINPLATFDLKVSVNLGNGYNQNPDYKQTVYGGQDNPVIIKIPSNAHSIKLIFAQTGFRLFNIDILTKEIAYTNQGVVFENPNLGGIITGNVKTQSKALLYMPIPYEDGWKCFVDRDQVRILRANFGFSAIEINPGEHKVEFRYTTPWLIIGSILSCLSIIIVLILWVLIKKRRSKDIL